MIKLLIRLLPAIVIATPVYADLGVWTVDVVTHSNAIPVRVSAATPALNALAIEAFSSNGRYKPVAGGFRYDIRFTPTGATTVRVDVTRPDGSSVLQEEVEGRSSRNALLAAADAVVDKTNGLGLRGYFTSRLAFMSKRSGHSEVYTSDLFFGEVRQITRDRAIAMFPRWSPDGERLLYTSYWRTGYPDIFSIDLASSPAQRSTFVSMVGTNICGRLSPDGRSATMVLSGEGSTEIYTSNPEGRAIRRLTRSQSVKSSPCWSPDSSRLIFASEPGPQLYLIPARGGIPERVTYGVSSYCAEPDWSRADPNKVAFTMRNGRFYQIGVLDLSTREAHQVSKAPFDGIEPGWLADGRHLVFTARNAYASRICILDTETGKSLPVSPASFGDAYQANVWVR